MATHYRGMLLSHNNENKLKNLRGIKSAYIKPPDLETISENITDIAETNVDNEDSGAEFYVYNEENDLNDSAVVIDCIDCLKT